MWPVGITFIDRTECTNMC